MPDSVLLAHNGRDDESTVDIENFSRLRLKYGPRY